MNINGFRNKDKARIFRNLKFQDLTGFGAMSKRKNYKIDSKEVGLEMSLLMFKFFLKTEYLHYGYFCDGLEADICNLKKAQEQYVQLLFSYIPTSTKTILDVGCGSGKTAQQLLAKGYNVDCVSPGDRLTAYARNLLGNTSEIFQCRFESLVGKKMYDLILFSESFQYVPMALSIPKALSLLNPGGHIIICDFFMVDPDGKCKLGGGHHFNEWLDYKNKASLKTLVEKDITAETSPTIDILNQFNVQALEPIWSSGWALIKDRFPRIFKFARLFYRKKIEKMENKHFSGQRTGENFRQYKKYMFYLLQPA
jgi:2-polyprenyl-3-methyl-5-hydroxy-6-metoxy-1,4-benzoquinol methylase